jgi:N-dimethylarginine dimethylaminohydrolase
MVTEAEWGIKWRDAVHEQDRDHPGARVEGQSIAVEDETSPLETVIVGIADSPGPARVDNEWSKEAIREGSYSDEAQLVPCVEGFVKVLTAAGVNVLRPVNRPALLQVFTRDVGFVIGGLFIRARMKETSRAAEYSMIEHHVRAVAEVVITPPESVILEGGDVVLHRDVIFVGVGRRTNQSAVDFLEEQFPKRQIVDIDLVHGTRDAHSDVLHLDCVLAPVGRDSAVVFANGFKHGIGPIAEHFPADKRIELTGDDLYNLTCNILSISPDHVVSCDSFTALNAQLEARGIKVSTVSYDAVRKLGGLLRCSTLPLCRKAPA